MAEPPQGPTIILIGGEVTLDGGARVDTRRPFAGDNWDFALRIALGGSESFWRKAKAITDIVLQQDASPAPWALAWVKKTIKQPRADGKFTRVRTISYLNGADRLGPVREETPPTTRYRISEHYLAFDEITTATDPAAFVGAFQTSYEDGTDIVGLAPLPYVLSRWPNTILVLPHTPLIEKKSRRLLDWYQQGARPPHRDQYGQLGHAKDDHPLVSRHFVAAYEEASGVRAASPYVIHDSIGVTFWADRGEIREAEDLEAALRFTLSRYDLNVGLLDLARDRILRTSLLDPEEPSSPLMGKADLPVDLASSKHHALKERATEKRNRANARRAIHGLLWPRLEKRGWYVPSWKAEGTEYRFAVGPAIRSPYPGVESEPALFFSLRIYETQATLNLLAVARIKATERFLAANTRTIEAVSGQRPDPSTNTVLRLLNGGWNTPNEGWNEELETVVECIEALMPRLRSTVDAAVRSRDLRR